MIFDLSEMPSDPERLKGKLLELVDVVEAMSTENLALAGQRDAAVLENEKLLLRILAAFKRALLAGVRRSWMQASCNLFLRRPSGQRRRSRRGEEGRRNPPRPRRRANPPSAIAVPCRRTCRATRW